MRFVASPRKDGYRLELFRDVSVDGAYAEQRSRGFYGLYYLIVKKGRRSCS